VKASPLRLEIRHGCPFFTLLFNIKLEVLARATGTEREIKDTKIKS
jgi:hypothetical protein